MRTSTKILLLAFVVLIAGLTTYDLRLVAEYRKGDYTDPFYGYTKLPYRDFDRVQLNSSSVLNIKLEQGPYKVLAEPSISDFLRIRQEGRELIISAEFPDHYRAIFADHALYISCPSLSAFQADANYTANGIPTTDTAVGNMNWKPTLITGFILDSLDIQEDHAGNIMLEKNKINSLSTTLGRSPRSGPALTIGYNNEFRRSDLRILHRSRLVLKGADIKNIHYQLSDSASLTLNGAFANRLLNPGQP